MNQKSELLETLELLERLLEGEVSRIDLQGETPRATFNRRIAFARHLGAVISTVRGRSGASVYRLDNAQLIRDRGIVASWLRNERQRSVV